MNNVIKVSLIAASLALASSVYAAGETVGHIKEQANIRNQERLVDRLVTITPDTRSVQVARFDTVRFVVQATGKTFIRNFDGWNRVIDLNQADATELGGQQVKVYVESRS